ncbi:universal stress protein [Halarchaeum sp. CBA1220]|nr:MULTISPECIES: universal stress protein [Halarchaeum]QLC33261.1 universal stress protein [Halarchaeum sp. CBA1220]
MTLEVETVLVPVDGSEASGTAAEYAVAIAERYDADVHALFVLGDDVAREIETGEADEEAVADGHGAFLDDVRAYADDSVDVATSIMHGFSTTRKTHHPGSVILDCADDVGADFVVLPREGRSSADPPGAVLEKVAEYVLLYASQPVLSV